MYLIPRQGARLLGANVVQSEEPTCTNGSLTMTESRLQKIVESAVERAIGPLENQIWLLNERLGERALTLAELSALSGKSTDTLYRRIKERKLRVASERPYRVLYADYERARDEGHI